MYIRVIDNKTQEIISVFCGRYVSVFIDETHTVHIDYNDKQRFVFRECVKYSHDNYKVISDCLTIYVNIANNEGKLLNDQT